MLSAQMAGGVWNHARWELREGDVHAYHKQLVVINLGSRESDAGKNLTGLSAKMTWVWFCRVEKTQSPFCICLCCVIEIKLVIYL